MEVEVGVRVFCPVSEVLRYVCELDGSEVPVYREVVLPSEPRFAAAAAAAESGATTLAQARTQVFVEYNRAFATEISGRTRCNSKELATTPLMNATRALFCQALDTVLPQKVLRCALILDVSRDRRPPSPEAWALFEKGWPYGEPQGFVFRLRYIQVEFPRGQGAELYCEAMMRLAMAVYSEVEKHAVAPVVCNMKFSCMDEVNSGRERASERHFIFASFRYPVAFLE